MHEDEPRAQARRIVQDYKDMLALGKDTPPRRLSREDRLRQVNEARRQAGGSKSKPGPQNSPVNEQRQPAPRPLLPRQEQLCSLRQRKRAIEEQVKHKEYEIKKLEQSRGKAAEPGAARALALRQEQSLEQFKLFRVGRLVKSLARLRLSFARMHFKAMSKLCFRIRVQSQKRQKQAETRSRIKVLKRVFAAFIKIVKQKKNQKAAQLQDIQAQIMQEKQRNAQDFFQFMTLRKMFKGLRAYKQKRKKQLGEKHLFGTGEEGRVRRMVEQLKQANRRQQQLQRLEQQARIQTQEAALAQPISQVSETQQNESEMGEVLVSKATKLIVCIPKGPVSQAQLARRNDELNQRNKKRKAALQQKRQERDQRRAQQLRLKEQQQQRAREEQKQRRLQQLKKFQARKRQEQQRKKRKQQQQRQLELKMQYAAAYHQRSTVKFSGLLFLKKAMSIIRYQRQVKLQQHKKKRLARAWAKLSDGVEVVLQQAKLVYSKRCVTADAFRKRKSQKLIIGCLRLIVESAAKDEYKASCLFQFKRVRGSFRGWKAAIPELSHQNMLIQLDYTRKIEKFRSYKLQQFAFRSLQQNTRQSQHQRKAQKFKEEFTRKVDNWLRELPTVDIQQYL